MASGAASSICRNRLSCMRGVVMVRYPDLGLELEMKTSLSVPAGRVDAPVHVQLLQDVVHMVLGRRHFDAQVAGDLFVGHALIDQLQDLPLPTCKLVTGLSAACSLLAVTLPRAIAPTRRSKVNATRGGQYSSPRTALSTAMIRSSSDPSGS